MRMVIQFLAPGMEDLDDRGHGSQIFFVRGKLQECFCGRIMKEGIQDLLILEEKRPQFSRNCEHDMEIGPVDHF